jgi:hypothetical protein
MQDGADNGESVICEGERKKKQTWSSNITTLTNQEIPG